MDENMNNAPEQFKNGMYKDRTKQAALQGLLMFVFLCGLGVMSYIVSMIPAGLFGVAIAKSSTSSQIIYDIQNLVNTALGLALLTFGSVMLAKTAGENDAMYAFRHGQNRKMDMRYLGLSVAIAVFCYIFVGVLMNVDFIIGPAKYLGIFLCRAERSINEGIKVAFGFRLLAMLICMVATTPCLIKGARNGFRTKMETLEEEEESELEQKKLREELEEERNKERMNKKF